jgi:hypothetical protein
MCRSTSASASACACGASCLPTWPKAQTAAACHSHNVTTTARYVVSTSRERGSPTRGCQPDEVEAAKKRRHAANRHIATHLDVVLRLCHHHALERMHATCLDDGERKRLGV